MYTQPLFCLFHPRELRFYIIIWTRSHTPPHASEFEHKVLAAESKDGQQWREIQNKWL
jgi:hypothetical protein